jgi:Uncharacterised nucleotidyltransferase
LVAKMLCGAWRESPGADDLSTEDVARVLLPLLGSGAGALGWCKIRGSALQDSGIAFEFRQAYRVHTLEAARHERDIEMILSLLRSRGVEPLLIKGWSIARVYPEKGMRPYGDTDLIVRRQDYAKARELVDECKAAEFNVDLHNGADERGYGNEDDLFANSHLINLGETDVRVPAPEDSLRILCVHFLRHGAFRPLWLCDVAVAVESRPGGFDWDGCLGSNRRVADWIACTIGLAHSLLGAMIEDTPVRRRAENLPSWLVPTVLKQWERPFGHAHGAGRYRAPMASYIRDPRGLLGDIRRRWPNPIEATVYVRAPFNEVPRFPFQISECIARASKFIAGLPKALRARR